jgi:hypothetical protein
MSFRETSLKLNKALTKAVRQANGIYFTPKPARDRLFEVLASHAVQPTTILEPSFGSGEFLEDIKERFPTATVYGVEKDEKVYTAYKAQASNTWTLKNMDFLEYSGEAVDLIVGNPPYFVTKLKEPAAMTNRGNIFVLFVYRCLKEHLKPGGVLAFILPTSFYNCSYYEPCRRYIRSHATILHVENLEGGFYETAQDTMLLVIQKNTAPTATPSGNPFFFERGEGLFISPHAAALADLVEGTDTLATLGFRVKTGEVVWNQEKESLTDSSDQGAIPVIYSNNIVNGAVRLLDGGLGGEKKQYIRGEAWKKPVTGPALVISRGYGNKYQFNYAAVEPGFEFYGENHVNVITPKHSEALANLERVKASLKDARTAEFIRLFVGNGALSKTELETVLPVF